MCSLLNSKHPGFIELSVSEQGRGNGLDVITGSHHYQKMQKQSLTMLIDFRVTVVKTYQKGKWKSFIKSRGHI